MVNTQTQFLPSLHDNSSIPAGSPGEWNHQKGIAYTAVADSLKRPEVGRNTDGVSSIPNMWGRPLLVDIVLRDEKHPLHESFKVEWKGMLAAIALAEVQGIKLKAELIDFQRLEDDAFIGALKELFPSKEKSAYQLRDNRNPWEQIYVFLLQDRPVGMTSPATLVCTAQKANWEGVPWYKKGQLHSPLSPVDYLTEDDKMQLGLWLGNLSGQLLGDSTKIKGIITEYQDELKTGLEQDIERHSLRLHSNEQYFGVLLALGKVTALSTPIQPQQRESSVKLVPKGRRVEETVLFIPEKEELLEQWSNKEPKYIQIYDTNILTFNFHEFERQHQGRVKYLTKEDIFEDQFYFLKGAGNLPGALLPEGVEDITYIIDDQEHDLTPLLPLKQEILQYFSPEELIKLLKIQPATIDNQSGVRVKLTLP